MTGLGRRLLLAFAVTVVALGATSSGADAHTGTEETTNVQSRITSDPQLDGVSWTVHTGGLLIEVVNAGDEVGVFAEWVGPISYGGQPFEVRAELRTVVGARDRFGRCALPPGAGTAAHAVRFPVPTIGPEVLVRLTVALGLLQALVVALVIGTVVRAERRHGGAHDLRHDVHTA